MGLWFVFLIAVAIAFLLLFGFTYDAEAFSRDDQKNLKNVLEIAEDRIVELDEDIAEQKIVMKDIENEITDLKDILRQTKADAGTSWDALTGIDEAESNLNDAITRSGEARTEYLRLLSEKSDNIKIKKETSKQLTTEVIARDYSRLNTKIGIELSTTCIVMIKANIESTCPTYKELISLDSSDTDISGKFTERFDGFFERLAPAQSNSWRAYDFDPTPRIFLDPPKGMSERIKLITLQSNFDTYTDVGNQTVVREPLYANVTGQEFPVQVSGETFRVLYHDVFVDKHCRHAIVNADNWQAFLPHVIYYMQNDCHSDFKTFNNVELIPVNYTPQDITTSQKYKDDKRLEFIKEFCIFKYKSCGA